MFDELRGLQLNPGTLLSNALRIILMVVLCAATPVSSRSHDELFKEHPEARMRYEKLRNLGGVYGWEWITAISKLTVGSS